MIAPQVPPAAHNGSSKADAKKVAERAKKGGEQPMRWPADGPDHGRWPDPRHAERGAKESRHRRAFAKGRPWHRPRGRRGFSLLELMTAAALGAVLTVAIAQLFTSTGRANAELVGHARMQESARHALGFLGRSIRGAGYLGCGGGDPRNGLRGDWRHLVEFDITTPVHGLDGLAGAGTWQPPLNTLTLRRGAGAPTFRRGGIDPARLRPGSDILLLRRLATPLSPLSQRVRSAGDPLVVRDEGSTLRKDRFAVLADCGYAGLFRVTSVARRRPAATLARAPGSAPFGNRAGSLLGGTTFGDSRGPGGAAVGLVLSEIYFVARAAGAAAHGEAAWALWRKTSAERPAELVRGIDELQLLFAVDESPDDAVAAPQRLTPPGRATGAVRSVHIAITASTVDAVGGDPPTRRMFAASFAVRNP